MSQHPISAQKVAEYLLYLDQETNGKDIAGRLGWEPISNLKLQKLLYYCQSIHLINEDSALFSDKIIAWKYGPVVEDVYYTHKPAMAKKFIDYYPQINQPELLKSAKNSIQLVYNVFFKYSGGQLVDMTHSEEPWRSTYDKNNEGVEITQKLIKKFFKERFNVK